MMNHGRQNVWPRTAWALTLLLRRAASGVLAASLCLPLLAAPLAAQPATDRAALVDRIQMLERRLEQLERGPTPPRSGRPSRPSATTAFVVPQPSAPPAPALIPNAPSSPTRARDPMDDEIPQEAFVFRDQAVTLRPGRAEASLDLGYLRDRRTVTHDRSASAVLTGRMGVADGIEASITAPFFISTRSFDHAPNFVTDRETRGIGDVSVQVNMRAWGERANWPGAVVTAGVVTPTGPSPFVNPWLGLSAQQVPVDITQFISARGAWALRGGMQFFKTVDPIILFGGISYEYAFPVEQSGITFRPGWRINYNAGLSFALSERSTLGFTFIGSYAAALRANAISYRATASEAAVFRFSLVQRLAPQIWAEPSLAIGLVSESPNFQIGLGLRYRF